MILALAFATSMLAALTMLSGCGKSCVYGGKTYDDGDEWTAACNTCSCNDGQFACTRLACNAPDAGD